MTNAKHGEVDARVLDLMLYLADQAERASNASVTLRYVQAMNQAAEAAAWLRSPAQPHGGSVTSEAAK